MQSFWTTVQTRPPHIAWPLYILMLLVLVGVILVAKAYFQKKWLLRLYQCLQSVQLTLLYIWYLANQISLANSLPFYHCRLAMFIILLCPGKSALKQYFALMGVSGAIFAIGYPVFDPYNFPHITAFSFLLGHYALLLGSLIYLLRSYDGKLLTKKWIVLWTFVLNAFLVFVNHLTGGNYGILRLTPFIANQPLWLRYCAVSLVLVAMLLVIDVIFAKRQSKLASS